MNASEQKLAVKKFVEKYLEIERTQGKITEQKYDRDFWNDLLIAVFAVPDTQLECQKYVYVTTNGKRHKKKIDLYKKDTHILIEQKGSDVDLDKPELQSDRILLTPYEQAERYYDNLNTDEKSQWIVVSNFKEIRIYDMNKRNTKSRTYDTLKLENLPDQYHRLKFLVDTNDKNTAEQETVSLKAGELVGDLYKKLAKKYKSTENDKLTESAKQNLNKLCVRIVFCLYAEDAGLFSTKTAFHDYLKDYGAKTAATGLRELFKYLDTENPTTLSDDNLKNFTYVNGGLFKEEIQIPQFDDEIFNTILNDCSAHFDWAKINPTIFGSIFESTLNPDTRRSGGMHYTSIKNIHKVIDPLFLDDLTAELEQIKKIKTGFERKEKLLQYQNKLAGLKFLDPACGSGNFLTESYLCLRRLENSAMDNYYKTDAEQRKLDLHTDEGQIIKVNINQFYGIEINDFAVAVAKTALWIAEAQMLAETVGIDDANKPKFFPLKDYKNIVEANALRIDWNEVVPKEQLNYIMGNPPFIGARMKDKEQAKEIDDVFGEDWKGTGNLDYVACWYKKAADYITDTNMHCAFVSTNSITQGEQVAILWKRLFEEGLHFDFAHRTFIWDSEANLKAHVYCVIIGFSKSSEKRQKLIFVSEKNGETVTSTAHIVKDINSYLVDADNVFIESRDKPICNVPKIGIGNKPIDDGNYLFNEAEYQTFVRKEPKAEKHFRRIFGAEEFINRKTRYCLWLGECQPEELLQMPECLKRVDAVRKYRLASKSPGTVKLAEKPTRFHVENIPTETYLLIPRVSSENRQYIPIGFMPSDSMATDSAHIVQNAKLWHFAVLTSYSHMAWMRAVCGRLEMRYRYSKDIVYNNFPWPSLSEKAKAELEKTAQAILDARNEHPFLSLAEMYGEHMYLYTSLVNAHKENDKAVLKAYGLKADTTEEEIVAFLMKRYQELTAKA